METGSNKSLFTLIAVVIFGIFLSLSYWLFSDEMKSVLADVMDSTSEMTSIKLNNNGLIPTDEKYFSYILLENGSVKITSYTGDQDGITDLIIPTYIGGYPVTVIDDGVFYNKGLTSVILPSTLTTIEDTNYGGTGTYQGAFANNNLTKLVIPNSVTYIGTCAFLGNKIEDVTFGDSLVKINHEAFNSNKLKNVVLPDSLRFLGGYQFSGNPLTSIELNDGLETIINDAFSGTWLTTLTLPKSIIVLGDYSLAGMGRLKEIKVPLTYKTYIESHPNTLVLTYTLNTTTRVRTPVSYHALSKVSYYE